MSDFNAKHVIEAMRSGVPSRAVGAYFTEARPAMSRKIQERIDQVKETGISDGMIFTGRYGEGKTHLLNSVFHAATTSNMVVSLIPLGKETPIDKLHLLYPKIAANTYLPGAGQPGFRRLFEEMTLGSTVAGELMAYGAKELETDKLYYLLKAFLGTQEEEEKLTFLLDLEGDFTNGSVIKKSFKHVTGTTAKFNQNFSKTKHAMDYFFFMSHLFRRLGYDGWIILFDEAELIGRFSKKARLKSYVQIQQFLSPSRKLEGVFSLFAMSSSYTEDVIDKRNELENLNQVFADDEESRSSAERTIQAILKAPELAPLTRAEIGEVLLRVQHFHGLAYDWTPAVSEETLYQATQAGGYLLRTKIRIAIEFLDQLYQYGEAGKTKITELGTESLEEESPALEL